MNSHVLYFNAAGSAANKDRILRLQCFYSAVSDPSDHSEMKLRRGDARSSFNPCIIIFICLEYLTRKSEFFLWRKRFVKCVRRCLIDHISLRRSILARHAVEVSRYQLFA